MPGAPSFGERIGTLKSFRWVLQIIRPPSRKIGTGQGSGRVLRGAHITNPARGRQRLYYVYDALDDGTAYKLHFLSRECRFKTM